jgi:HlyD family secretion protein
LDTSSRKAQRAFVWLKVGDTLVEKRIRVGLNDDTHVQVLKGLSIDDEIATGEEIPVKGAAAGPAARSPFMPARRGGGNSRPAGGAAKPK